MWWFNSPYKIKNRYVTECCKVIFFPKEFKHLNISQETKSSILCEWLITAQKCKVRTQTFTKQAQKGPWIDSRTNAWDLNQSALGLPGENLTACMQVCDIWEGVKSLLNTTL